MVGRISVSALAAVLVAVFWVGNAAAATSPVQLLVPQGTAFSVLHYDCGGIGETAHATRGANTMDPAAGGPPGDVLFPPTCSPRGQGRNSVTRPGLTTTTPDPLRRLSTH